ncbi:ester cyclase [Paeniglutamicibacter sp. NPDC091659]|uniref:ester cyclase n=1 Tax=Paeniglutamicibacter sp. NPDC091659 TaxID=3364389 RepID=UPI00380D2416
MSDGTGLIKRFYLEVLAGGNYDLIDELIAEGFVDHESLPGQPPGKEGARFFVDMMRAAFPDLSVKSSEPALVDGNHEAVRTVLTGTHQGELMGVAATGRTVEIESIDIIRAEDGKVAEHWGITDSMSIMQQLGALPE